MGSSRVEQALNELDPGSRAVVDLSLGTDFSDENIATLIRVEPDEVARRRDRAIDALQQKLGGASHDDVVLELCAAMGVEPSESLLEGGVRNGSATTTANGAVGPADDSAPPDEQAEPPEPSAPEAEAMDSEATVETPAETQTAEDAVAQPEAPPASEAGAQASDDDEAGVIAVPFESVEDVAVPGDGGSAEAETGMPAAGEPAAETYVGGRPDPDPDPEPPPPPPAPPSADRERDDSSGSGSRRRVGVLLAALAAGAIVVVGVVALSSGGAPESEPVEAGAPANEAPAEPAPAEEPEVSATLDGLPDAPAGGEAEVSLDGDALTVTLDGLPAPAATYEAWLFTSVLDSRPLGSIDDGSGSITARLPDSAERYEYLDISVQPSGNAQHSGQSIFRVPVADLLG